MTRLRYVPRTLETVLIRAAKGFPAVALSGARQTGKSTLLKQLFSRSHQYVSFDDPAARERAISDPRLFLDQIQEPVIFDEIQYVPELTSYLKIKIDQERQKRGRFIFTGSQQFPLIKNLGDSLAGRVALLDLFPFEIAEKRRVGFLKRSLETGSSCFTDACLRGSFPEVVTQKKMDLDFWYGSYLGTYLERDVRGLHDIGSLRDFQQLMRLLAGRTSQVLNLSSLASDLGIAVNTVKRWLSVLEASRIVYLLPPYYRNFGKRVTKSPKIYFFDVGLVCYLTGIRAKDLLWKGPMAGACFENFCLQETLKLAFHRGIRPSLFYFRSHNGLEVDLLIEGKGQRLFPIEFKLTQTPRPALAKPIERFRGLLPKLRIEKGKVVCLAESRFALSRDVEAEDWDRYLSGLPTVLF